MIADALQRQLGIDPCGSFIVQAPAGSGKTELLTQRFLALLAGVSRPEEILAITFTRKAAGEMRHRLLESLERATGPRPQESHAACTWELGRSVLETDRLKGWRLLENPGLLKIQTIDSLNASLVRAMPILSRFGGINRIAEEPQTLYRQAAENLLVRLGTKKEGSDEIAALLQYLDNRMDRLRDLFIAMLSRRDQWLRHVVWQNPDQERALLERGLADIVEKTTAQLHALIPLHLQAEILRLGCYAAETLSANPDNPLRLLRDCTCFPGPSADELALWKTLADLLLVSAGTFRKRLDVNCGFPPGKNNPAATMKQDMTALLEALRESETLQSLLAEVRSLPEPRYSQEQWQVLRAVVVLLPIAVAELWAEFQAAAEVDFAEVALKALEGLGRAESPTDLLLKLDNRINHILVDEFQDTSQLQFNLIRQLVGGWTPGDGRTLFLVGDPMQSIYRFREAEVGLFLKAWNEGIGPVALQPLQLCCNFRSQASIVHWVNATFAQIFPSEQDSARGAVSFAEAQAVKPPLSEPSVHLLPFAGRDDQAEALAVAEIAERVLQSDNQGTVAVLVRSRAHLAVILKAFKSRGLRYQAQDIDPLHARSLVRDLISLVRALLHWGDRLAWLSVLRAPWCGLLLEDLLALCGGSILPIGDLLADPEVLARLSEDGRTRAMKVAPVLFRAVEHRGRIGLRALVEGTWLSLGAWCHLGAADLEDARTVFELLEQKDRGGDLASLGEFEQSATRLFAAPDTDNDGRLQVMTIHKSKGLEFDTVILPGLGKKSRGGDKHLLRWLESPDGKLLLAPIPGSEGERGDEIYELIGEMEKDKTDLELVRLLYVAATRAKKQLYLCGHLSAGKNGEFSPAGGSFLHKLWPALSDAFSAGLHPEEAGEEITEKPESEPPPLQRYPAHWVPPSFPAPPGVPAAKPLSPSELSAMDMGKVLFSGWEAEVSRHVGTVTHQLLEDLAKKGSGFWTQMSDSDRARMISMKLEALGVPGAELEQTTNKVVEAVQATSLSPRGQWILAGHSQAESELALSGVVEGALVHAVIDRTFVDEKGTRWIIDFKTSTPSKGQKLHEFLQVESTRYRRQLQSYESLFRHFDPGRPVRSALYFPLCDGWHEFSTT